MTKNDTLIPKTREKKKRAAELIESSKLTYSFYLMLILSSVIVSLGLLLDNIPVIIGGMLITPLLSPLLTLALGIVVVDKKVMWWSIKIIVKSIGIILIVSLIMTIIAPEKVITEEISSKSFVNLTFFYVAIASGVAAAFAWARKELSAILPGVAIAVALLPPIATISIGVGMLNPGIIIGALQSAVANLIGIIVSAVLVFSLLGFYKVKKVAEREIKKEVEKEKNHNHSNF